MNLAQMLSGMGGGSNVSIESALATGLLVSVARAYKVWQSLKAAGKDTSQVEAYMAGIYELGTDADDQLTKQVFARSANLLSEDEAKAIGKAIRVTLNAVNNVIRETEGFDNPMKGFIAGINEEDDE